MPATMRLPTPYVRYPPRTNIPTIRAVRLVELSSSCTTSRPLSYRSRGIRQAPRPPTPQFLSSRPSQLHPLSFTTVGYVPGNPRLRHTVQVLPVRLMGRDRSPHLVRTIPYKVQKL